MILFIVTSLWRRKYEDVTLNLGPLNELKGLKNEVLASDPDRSYLRKEDRISQLTVTKDVHKSAAIATFHINNENKSRFPKSFWSEN